MTRTEAEERGWQAAIRAVKPVSVFESMAEGGDEPSSIISSLSRLWKAKSCNWLHPDITAQQHSKGVGGGEERGAGREGREGRLVWNDVLHIMHVMEWMKWVEWVEWYDTGFKMLRATQENTMGDSRKNRT